MLRVLTTPALRATPPYQEGNAPARWATPALRATPAYKADGDDAPLLLLRRGGSEAEGVVRFFVCGVDEAGRGPLAGPVSAAAVILDDANPIAGLADSKKLSERQRDRLAIIIRERALAWAVAYADVAEIDSLNILQASLLAMRRAVLALHIQPQQVLVDGLYCPKTGIPSQAIVKGDSKVAAISAASILAKTARDALMLELHQQYPHYGFASHKGYPTAAHLVALREHGVSIVHRKSFRPVRELLSA